jgi:hypothetical protein
MIHSHGIVKHYPLKTEKAGMNALLNALGEVQAER